MFVPSVNRQGKHFLSAFTWEKWKNGEAPSGQNLLMGRLGISYGALEYLCITEGTLDDAQILEG